MSGSYEIIGKIIDNWKNDSAWERSFDQEKLTAVDVKLEAHEAFASESFDWKIMSRFTPKFKG